jgi:enolase
MSEEWKRISILVESDHYSCVHCAVNTEGDFCQKFKIPISDNEDFKEYHKARGSKCKFYLPRGVDRAVVRNSKGKY